MSRGSSGLFFIAACVGALALRLLLPAGWMPETNGPLLTLCSGAVLPVDPPTPVGDPEQPCSFALSLGTALLAAALLLPLPLLALPLLPAPVAPPARRCVGPHRPRPPGQGPPLL